MQSKEAVENELSEKLKKLHSVQKEIKELYKQGKDYSDKVNDMNYLHGVVRALRWSKTNFGSL